MIQLRSKLMKLTFKESKAHCRKTKKEKRKKERGRQYQSHLYLRKSQPVRPRSSTMGKGTLEEPRLQF